jgi:hypothetical protein
MSVFRQRPVVWLIQMAFQYTAIWLRALSKNFPLISRQVAWLRTLRPLIFSFLSEPKGIRPYYGAP